MTFSEATRPGTIIVAVETSDDDSSRNSVSEYSLLDARQLPFRIQSRTGELYTNEWLDYETTSSYTITVVARNTAAPHLSSTATVEISVTDVNDIAPVFEKTVYRFKVQEFSPYSKTPVLPKFIGQVRANDKDEGLNGEVRYRLAHSHRSFVQIDELSGNLTLVSQLDRESAPRHQFRVLAVDRGFPRMTGTCVVRLAVLDVNDNPPVFVNPQPGKQAVVMLRESASVNSVVYRVRATDRDDGINANLRYSWAPGMPRDEFKLNEATGEIRTRKLLDYERASSYRLAIVAKDQNKEWRRRSTAYVTLRVADINDNAPVFVNSSDLILNVPDADFKPGNVLARLLAIDKEPVSNGNGLVRYNITGGSASKLFSVDATNGDISVATDIVHAPLVHTTHTLQVTASDTPTEGPFLFASYDLRVHVIPELVFFSIRSQTVRLSEHTRAGRVVTRVQARDK